MLETKFYKVKEKNSKVRTKFLAVERKFHVENSKFLIKKVNKKEIIHLYFFNSQELCINKNSFDKGKKQIFGLFLAQKVFHEEVGGGFSDSNVVAKLGGAFA